jgi:hypothetical protein
LDSEFLDDDPELLHFDPEPLSDALELHDQRDVRADAPHASLHPDTRQLEIALMSKRPMPALQKHVPIEAGQANK